MLGNFYGHWGQLLRLLNHPKYKELTNVGRLGTEMGHYTKRKCDDLIRILKQFEPQFDQEEFNFIILKIFFPLTYMN